MTNGPTESNLRFVPPCPDTAKLPELFAKYIDGDISDEAQDELDKHNISCDPCRQEFLRLCEVEFGPRPEAYKRAIQNLRKIIPPPRVD